MSNDEKPITSRRERRLAQAGLASAGQEAQLTPAQAEAEERAKAEAEAQAVQIRNEALAAAHSAAAAAARGEKPPSDALGAASLPGAPGPARERSSQMRARDRAAQRALRELAEKEQAAQGGSEAAPLSRRELRRRETGRVPVVAGTTPAMPAPKASTAEPNPDAAERPRVAPAQPGTPGAAVPGLDPAPPTAMQGIVPQGLTVTPALGPETGSFRKLSQDQINAAREMLREQAKNQAAMLEGQRVENGTDVDPAVLAEQVAMAQRAAILNRRAQARQRLEEENRRESAAPPRRAPAPASTDNLAMVTPLEFVRLPGIAHPVMKPPSTTHVPVVTGVTAKQPVRTRSDADAPAAAPVAARSAHGLEPLDSARTVGRAERERLILLGIGAVGIIALIIAIIMIVLGGR